MISLYCDDFYSFFYTGLHLELNPKDQNTYIVNDVNGQYAYWNHINQIQRQEVQVTEERPSFIRMVIEGINQYNVVPKNSINLVQTLVDI